MYIFKFKRVRCKNKNTFCEFLNTFLNTCLKDILCKEFMTYENY